MKPTVSVDGEVDITCAQSLRDLLVAATESEVVASLAGLAFLDARGMAAFVEAHHCLREQGRSLVLVDVPPFVRKLFEITELAAVLDIR